MTASRDLSGVQPEVPARLLDRAAWAILVLAIVTRLVAIVQEPAYLHPDALYQGLEPAYWLLHGHGVLPWEFREGLRSWFLPGALAIPMAAGEVVGTWWGGGTAIPIGLVRAFVASLDVLGIVLSMRIARGVAGPIAALGTGTVLALHPAFVVMATNPLVDVPAAVSLVWLCERALLPERVSPRRGLAIGVAASLTLALRIQAAPAVLAVLVVLALRTRRGRLAWDHGALARAFMGGLAVLALHGALDWATWGAPFVSIWRYVAFQVGEGARFGVMPWDRYVRDLALALPLVWPALLVLAAFAMRRAPALAFVFLAFVLPHQSLGLRVWRFMHPGLLLFTILAGIGLPSVLERVAFGRAKMRLVISCAAAVLFAIGLGVAVMREVPWATTWLFHQGGETAVARSRGLHRAYVELSKSPPPAAIVQVVLPSAGAPGHALLGHDVPVVSPLGGTPDVAAARRADVWIQPAGAPSPPGFARAWCDEASGVCIDRLDTRRN